MRKSIFPILFLLVVAQSVVAQKIGYFDANYVIAQLPKAKAANADLKAYASKLQQDLETKDKELKTKYQQYVEKAQTMPEPSRQAAEKELTTLQNQLQEFQTSAEESVRKKENDLMTPILQDLEKTIKEVSKENGFTYVIRQEALLYEPEDTSLDVSILVLKKLGITPAPRNQLAPTTNNTTTPSKTGGK